MQSRCITVFDGLLLWLHSIDLIISANCREIFGSALFSWHQVTSLQFNWPGFATPPIKYLTTMHWGWLDNFKANEARFKSYTNMSIFDRHISPSNRDQVDRSDRLPQWCYEVIHKQKPQPMGHPWDPVGPLDTGTQNAWLAWLTNLPSMWWKTIRSAFLFATIDTRYANWFTWICFPPSHRTINFKMFSKIKTTCRNNWRNEDVSFCSLHFVTIFTEDVFLFTFWSHDFHQ